jgi:hypothetical protein
MVVFWSLRASILVGSWGAGLSTVSLLISFASLWQNNLYGPLISPPSLPSSSHSNTEMAVM